VVTGQRRKTSPLEGHGIALGVTQDMSLLEHRIMLQPGDALIAYTDGITEAMQADHTEWGMERFTTSVRKSKAGSASELLDDILEALDDFVGDAPQSDDVTVWVLKREPFQES
jgi:sigma-B regulation protein RsbU (phosphoserine phosphatase)